MFENIPAELQQLNQWVVWRYEQREGTEKRTKVPYSAITKNKASVTDSATWTGFAEAVYALQQSWGHFNGIGFVLTEKDPYTFIDLDAPKGTQLTIGAAHERQQKIYDHFSSYSERSPSGNGLHIIVKAAVREGRRRADVEMYSSGRYMTMTGDVYGGRTTIVERQELVDTLWNELGGGNTRSNSHIGNVEESGSDDDVLRVAMGAANGQKFTDLWEGNWQERYTSQSEADYALVDMLAFYTQNREQITRLFLASALGQRDKATKNRTYVSKMIEKAFDRILPPVNIDALRDKFVAAQQASKHVVDYLPEIVDKPVDNIYTVPEGLVGDIARFIYSAAPRPVAEIALVGAIGLVAGICGRSYNIKGMGLNQYILLLAATGVGKEAINSGTEKLMRQVQRTVPAANEFIGPAEIASPQALAKYLSGTSKSFVSIVGEFGLRLQQMTATNANPSEVGMRRTLLDLYNKSGQDNALKQTIYSQKENNTEIVTAPAFTMVAESTPERFYQSLNEGMVAEGFLPRFTVIEYHGDRPDLSETYDTVQPSMDLLKAMSGLCANSLSMNQRNVVTNVLQDEGATKLLKNLNTMCDAKIRGSREVVRQLWNRTHAKGLKLAATVAVGVNPYHPCITEDIALWAIRIVVADTENMLERFASGLFGAVSSEGKQVDDVIRIVGEYLEADGAYVKKYGALPALHADKIIPYSFLQRRLSTAASMKDDRMGATAALKRSINVLVDRGDLLLLNKVMLSNKYKTTCVAYAIADPSVFIRVKQAKTKKD